MYLLYHYKSQSQNLNVQYTYIMSFDEHLTVLFILRG